MPFSGYFLLEKVYGVISNMAAHQTWQTVTSYLQIFDCPFSISYSFVWLKSWWDLFI